MTTRLRAHEMRWCLVATLLLIPILSACQAAPEHHDNPKARPVTAPTPTLTLQALEMRLGKLEKLVSALTVSPSIRTTALVSCKGEGFTTLQTNTGWLLLSCEDASPYLNGFKLRMKIGNPSTLTYHGVKLSIWEPSGVVKDTEISQDLPPGAWTSATVVVTPATAADVADILINIEPSKVSLRRPR